MKRFVSLVLAIVFLTGCGQQALFDRLIPKQDAEFAKGYLSLLQSGDFARVEQQVAPALKGPQLRPTFPTETPKDVRVVGSQTNTFGDTTQASLTFEYEYANGWLLANVVLQRTGNSTVVEGVQVQRLKEPLEQTNRFTFAGKGPAHYGILAGAIVVPLLIVYALVMAIRTPVPKRKWLWVIFIVFGFIQISLNWTTGHLTVNPLSFLLCGGGFTKSPYGPVVVMTSIPLGAILFLLRRKQWLAPPEGVNVEDSIAT